MWVLDATPLIYLARVERLGLLSELDGRCVVPEPVHDEVVETGLERGYTDARRVDRAVESGVVDVVSVPATSLGSRLGENANLSDADRAVLAHAAANDGTAVMDERYGRDVAETEGIPTRGTVFLVLSLVADGPLSVEAAREVVDAMVDEGWYCAPDVYASIVRKLDELGE